MNAETTVSGDWEAPDDFHPDDTDVLADFERCEFLDLSRPLLPQLWHAKFSKAFYLEQVHQPRHVSYSAKLFPWPALEALTLTPWYIIPIVWGPITLTFTYLSLLQFSPATSETTFRTLASGVANGILPGLWTSSAMLKTGALWAVGMFLWTLLEYGFHRCLFHVVRPSDSRRVFAACQKRSWADVRPFACLQDDKLPDANWSMLLHFLLHGVHHYLPMVRPSLPSLPSCAPFAKGTNLTLVSFTLAFPQDGMRLVMPPTLFFILQLPFTNLAHILFPAAVANGIICGAFTAYICYDCFHYL